MTSARFNMNEMNIIDKLFFELIRVSIGVDGCLSHTPKATEWQELYAMAKKQSLVGICFAGVQRLQRQSQIPPEALYLQWMGMAAKIQRRNEIVNQQCIKLQKNLKDAGLRSSILKGQGIAALYKVSGSQASGSKDLSMLRQSGDIDVYVDSGRKRAIEYVRGIQDEVDWDYKHLHLEMFPATEVELHYRPEVVSNLWMNRRLQRWFEKPEVQSAMFQVSGELVTPSVEFNRFYILLHIYRHFLFEGVGLRQVMDWYFVLRTQINDRRLMINDDLLRLLKDFGMMRFARGLVWVVAHVFLNENDDENIFLGIEPDEKEGRYILETMMRGGNFGHHDVTLRSCGETSAKNWKRDDLKRRLKHSLHLLGHYPEEVIWVPIYMVWHFGWKKFRLMINDY